MASPFMRALAAADADLDLHIGEQIQVTPMLSGDFDLRSDPDRPAFDAMAIVTDQSPSSMNVPRLDARIVHEEWTVEILRSALAGRVIKARDHILLLDRPGSPTVSVNFVKRTDETRMAYVCGPVGGA